MNTTVEVPTALVEEARRCLGFKSRTDTIVLALRELVRREQASRGLVAPESEGARQEFRKRLSG